MISLHIRAAFLCKYVKALKATSKRTSGTASVFWHALPAGKVSKYFIHQSQKKRVA
jgi:hypothetical protein